MGEVIQITPFKDSRDLAHIGHENQKHDQHSNRIDSRPKSYTLVLSGVIHRFVCFRTHGLFDRDGGGHDVMRDTAIFHAKYMVCARLCERVH